MHSGPMGSPMGGMPPHGYPFPGGPMDGPRGPPMDAMHGGPQMGMGVPPQNMHSGGPPMGDMQQQPPTMGATPGNGASEIPPGPPMGGPQGAAPSEPQAVAPAPVESELLKVLPAPTPEPGEEAEFVPERTESGDIETAYYPDFWNYAAWYGEDAARQYYGGYAPPPGTPKPEESSVVAPVT